jgi:Fur family transcriptional regulator, peroxide stress response regulator
MTKHRQEIIDLLEAHEEALSAAEIHFNLPHINLATIYRNLESFVESGTVTKLNLGGDEARYEIQHEPHHHAICDDCHKVIHFTVNDEELIKEFALSGFTIKNLEVTLRGTCTHQHKNSK